MSPLSTGAISAMYQGIEDQVSTEPVVQVLSVKKVASSGANGTDRYRLILSDGEHFAQAMLATALNDFVAGDAPVVTKNSIIKLLTYAVNDVQTRRIIICLTLEPFADPCDKIGNPTTIDNISAGAVPAGGDVQMRGVARSPAPEAPAPQAQALAGRGGSNASKTAAVKRGGGGFKGKTDPNAPIYPIESLSPYQNKWTIKARVTSKSEIRHWSNQRGDGKLFSVNLLDESGEIRATGFNDACDNLYPILEEGKVYRISKARVNIAKKQFTNLNNEYEIMFEKGTEVELDDDDAAPKMKFSFTELAELTSIEKDGTCDVLGVVQDNGQLSEITAKATQKQIKKRELTIVDRSQYSCRVTLWGRQAETWQDVDGGIIALKGVKVGDFGGRSLSVGGSATIVIDPDIEEAHQLRGWYDTQGQNQSFAAHSNSMASGGGSFKPDAFKTLRDVVDENLGMSDKPDFFATRATITYIKGDNMSYPACPTDRCNKKMSQEGDDLWRCEKCEMTYPAPQYRYILSLAVNDYTSQIWLSGFNEVGQEILGKTADEMQQLKDDDEQQFTAIITSALGKQFNFNVKAKADSFGDQTKVRYQLQRLAPVNFVEAAKSMYETCMTGWA
ncbi:hypothetical protein JCM1841_001858 [Sporobolomyces salmonicolor]